MFSCKTRWVGFAALCILMLTWLSTSWATVSTVTVTPYGGGPVLPTVQFGQSSYTASGTQVQLDVNLSAANSTASVQFSTYVDPTQPNEAVPGVDFTSVTNGPLSFPSGLTANALIDLSGTSTSNVQFSVQLVNNPPTSPFNCILGPTFTAIVLVVDDIIPPTTVTVHARRMACRPTRTLPPPTETSWFCRAS